MLLAVVVWRSSSVALLGDTLHNLADALTALPLAVAFTLGRRAGSGRRGLGFPSAEPLVGLLITAAILVVLRDAAREVYRRLMDAVDPELVDRVEAELLAKQGVLGLGQVRLRWIGHALRAECEVVVDPGLSVVEGHHVAEHAQHRLLHQIPRLTAALVHADPLERGGVTITS